MKILFYFLTAVLAYLIGTFNLSYIISRIKNIDMRAHGSGNLGTCNAVITLGWRLGIAVAICDIGKAFAAVSLAQLIFPGLPFIGAVAGVFCVIGHISPFYLRFRGGKGFASFLGMTAALNWHLAIAMGIIVVIAIAVTDYIVVGTVVTVVSVPLYLGIVTKSIILALVLFVASAFILVKHRENYVKIANGTEIGFRKVNHYK